MCNGGGGGGCILLQVASSLLPLLSLRTWKAIKNSWMELCYKFVLTFVGYIFSSSAVFFLAANQNVRFWSRDANFISMDAQRTHLSFLVSLVVTSNWLHARVVGFKLGPSIFYFKVYEQACKLLNHVNPSWVGSYCTGTISVSKPLGHRNIHYK